MARVGTEAAFRIDGLAAFQRDCRRAGIQIDQAVKAINVEAANDIIGRARGNASTRMQAKAAEQLRPYRSARMGGVNLRATSSVPYAMGAEFGAYRDLTRHRSSGAYIGYRQYEPWKGSGGGAGYFLWPAVRETNVPAMYEKAFDELVDTLGAG